MKVALLTNIVPPYRQQACNLLHDHAKALGGGLHVFCTDPSEPQRNWPEKDGAFSRTRLAGIRIPLGENRQMTLPFGLATALRRCNPDIVILAGFGPAQWRAQLWAYRRNRPSIVQFDGWAGSDDCYDNIARRVIRHHMLHKANAFVAASNRGRDWFLARNIEPSRIFTAPIPTSFSPASSRTAPHRSPFRRRFDILWCGRTTRNKGFDRFIAIARDLAERGLVRQLGIVGCLASGKAATAIRQAGLADITHLQGQLPPDHLPDLLSDARLVLFPSRQDAYGVGVVEAVSCGAVVLASDAVGCAPDILGTSEILPVDATGDWVTACIRLLKDENLWAETARNQFAQIAPNTAQTHANILWQAAICAQQASRGLRE